jgi:ERCC4-type nuclease
VQERLVVDIYERESRVLDALRSLEVQFVRRALSLGDYAVGGIVVERKTVRDLHTAILKRRFWRQVARLQHGARQAYVLVEGADIDDGPLRPEAVRGALVALAELGVPVLRTLTPEETALWLRVIAERPRRRARRYLPQRIPLTSSGEAMLCAVPGISTVTARALLARFGTVAEIAKSDPASWLSADGVGPARAASLAKALHQAPPIPPRTRRANARRVPST